MNEYVVSRGTVYILGQKAFMFSYYSIVKDSNADLTVGN